MPITKLKPMPQQPHVPLVTVDLPTGMVAVPRPWAEWLQSIDSNNRLMASAPTNAANDAAAAAAGVPLGGFYRNGNALQIRLV